MNVKDNI